MVLGTLGGMTLGDQILPPALEISTFKIRSLVKSMSEKTTKLTNRNFVAVDLIESWIDCGDSFNQCHYSIDTI
jgi:hypothetical protein